MREVRIQKTENRSKKQDARYFRLRPTKTDYGGQAMRDTSDDLSASGGFINGSFLSSYCAEPVKISVNERQKTGLQAFSSQPCPYTLCYCFFELRLIVWNNNSYAPLGVISTHISRPVGYIVFSAVAVTACPEQRRGWQSPEHRLP